MKSKPAKPAREEVPSFVHLKRAKTLKKTVNKPSPMDYVKKLAVKISGSLLLFVSVTIGGKLLSMLLSPLSYWSYNFLQRFNNDNNEHRAV